MADHRRARHRPIDLVVVQPLSVRGSRRQAGRASTPRSLENIDIGGPTMVRAAAKNFTRRRRRHRARALRRRARRAHERRLRARPRDPRELAANAFNYTAQYDSAIATWFSETRRRRPRPLRARPTRSHRPALRREPAPARRLLRRGRPAAPTCCRMVTQEHGKELSYNNLLDLDAGAAPAATSSTLPCCVILKHNNPCGVRDRRDARGRLRQGARLRPAVRLRRRHRHQPRGRRVARREARRALRRGALRAGLHRRGAGDPHAQKDNLRILATASAALAGGDLDLRGVRGGLLRAGPRRRHRPARRDAGRHAGAPDREAVGRPALRLARLQARQEQRDRDRPTTSRRSASAPVR